MFIEIESVVFYGFSSLFIHYSPRELATTRNWKQRDKNDEDDEIGGEEQRGVLCSRNIALEGTQADKKQHL